MEIAPLHAWDLDPSEARALQKSLAARVDGYELVPAGSEEELEIRAATVWAVELLRRALLRWGVDRTASAIDYRLWAESQASDVRERQELAARVAHQPRPDEPRP